MGRVRKMERKGGVKKTVAVLTGGGDCPGINPVIRAVVRKALEKNYEVVGIKNGWKGLIEKDILRLNLNSVSDTA